MLAKNKNHTGKSFFMCVIFIIGRSAQMLQSGCHLSDYKKKRGENEEEKREKKKERSDVSLTPYQSQRKEEREK